VNDHTYRLIAYFDSCTRAAEPAAAEPDVDLSPALEQSIARVQQRKRNWGSHVENCNCDYDCDNDGYFECSTDPRCAALREAR